MDNSGSIFEKKLKNMFYKKKKDPFTGEEFTPKRYNQKFACRNNQIAYNNVKARKIREKKKPIDNVLETNRKILIRILKGAEAATVSKEFLLGAGFNFSFFNRSFSKDKSTYQCVYNYAITKLENGKYKIFLMV